MKKILLSLLTMCFALGMNAQKVTLDFTDANNTWGLGKGSDNKTTDETSYTNGTYTIKVAGANGCYYHDGNKTMIFGKKDAYMILPKMDFKVSKIEIVFSSGGSGKTTYNIFVGDKAVSSEATGCKANTVMEIESGSQNPGTEYTIKVLNDNNFQFMKINFYEAGNDATVDIKNTQETAYTVSKAIELVDAGEGLNDKVYVKGTVKTVEEISVDYGNATYVITDGTKDITIFRGSDFEGAKFTNADAIQDGDEVVVYGKITYYEQKSIYEVEYAQLISLNGKTSGDNTVDPTPGTDPTPEYTVVGKGTLAEPYTTEDIIKGVYNAENTTEGVWVKGTILGCFGSEKEPISQKEAVASNIALGNADATCVIPVQLVYVKDGDNRVREAINVMDNPSNIGKEIYVFGNIEKYFSVAGMKSTSNYSWDGTDTGIQGVNYTPATRNAVYNMSGVKVTNTEAIKRGVYIVDGQKKYVK